MGHPYAPMATVVALSMASLSPCYYLVGALKGTINKCRDSVATPPGSLASVSTASERPVPVERSIGKKPGFQADRA